MNSLTSTDLKYVGESSPHLLCSICLSPFLVPVTAKTCSHTFCRSCITEAIRHSSQQCPVDRQPLTVNDLQPANPIIRSLVNELIVECPHHDAGCPQLKLRRDALNTHLENECMHTPMTCQLPGCNTTLPMAEMIEHQEMHRIELQLGTETDDPSHPYSFPQDDFDTESPRTERLSALDRNWSALRSRSHANLRELARAQAESPAPSFRDTPRASSNRPLPPLPPSPRIPSELPFLARAVNSYESSEPGELSFVTGDVLRIVNVREDGWWEGDHIDFPSLGRPSRGPWLIPSSFVEQLTDEEPPETTPRLAETPTLRRSSSLPLSRMDDPFATRNNSDLSLDMYTDWYPTDASLDPQQPSEISWNEPSTSTSSTLRPDNRRYSSADSFSSMYMDEPPSPPPPLPPPPPQGRLSPVRRRCSPTSAQSSSQSAEGVMYYVKASGNYSASHRDDFDFQEGDVMAVTSVANDGDMRGYLLDDARRQDHRGRDRIPAERVVLLY